MMDEHSRDVGVDGTAEQHRLLRHDDHVAVQPARVDGADVHSVDAHTAAVHVVEALQQAQHRGLAYITSCICTLQRVTCIN